MGNIKRFLERNMEATNPDQPVAQNEGVFGSISEDDMTKLKADFAAKGGEIWAKKDEAGFETMAMAFLYEHIKVMIGEQNSREIAMKMVQMAEAADLELYLTH